MKTRALYVDGKLKEYTVGPARDITNRMFVVRRMFQLNDALADEKQPRWRWQLGGWIAVDRSSGRITSVRLPDFDADLSVVSWYRDYAAYCGISEDKKLYAVVLQLGRRKPNLRQLVAKAKTAPDFACGSPAWERDPARVTFKFNEDQTLTFLVDSNAQGSSADEPADAAE